MNSNAAALKVLLAAVYLVTLVVLAESRAIADPEDFLLQHQLDDAIPSVYSPSYVRRNGAYWSPEAEDMALSVAPLDNYRILPPIKRTEVRTRSILCYFNSVSCFGRQTKGNN